jgi:prepilin-type N-terminal cleavage/methylation domain-containing protein
MRYSDSRADSRSNLQSGFTFIEVMVALAITTIVMAAVF